MYVIGMFFGCSLAHHYLFMTYIIILLHLSNFLCILLFSVFLFAVFLFLSQLLKSYIVGLYHLLEFLQVLT